MTPISPDSRLAIDPQLVLRPDVDRAVLLTRPPPLADRGRICRLVHPTEAIILCLLDGQRTLQEVAELWARLTTHSLSHAYADVSRVIEFYTTGERGKDRILISTTGGAPAHLPIYDPLRFMVPNATVNLTDRRLRNPYFIYLLPTLYCPQRCVYCYAPVCARPEKGLLGVERLREIFSELRGLGVEVIQMSGGEVFSRRDIFEILQAIVLTGLVADVPTKFPLTAKMALRLRDIGIRMLQFSIDSSIPETLDRMVRVPDYHRGAFHALENLRQAGLTVRVNTVVTPINVRTVGRLLDYLGALGNIRRVSLTPYGRSSFRHYDELFLSTSDLDRLSDQASDSQLRHPHMRVTVSGNVPPKPQDAEQERLTWERRAFCTGNRDGFVILPDGRVTPCEELYDHPSFVMGDLSRQSVMEMWNSPKALALIFPDQGGVPDGPCKTCEDFSTCNSGRGRCWRDILKSYGWDKPHWPDPRCPKAPIGNRLS